ncbi:ABC transporter permease [Propionibacterium freudenreichii]|uniref:ABC transporter permease n=1 Tax=Propionibacterium freudenreichii TaxID=1744 RepID=UPI0021A45976|nr:ABC transporter permease [Propionibacterium freudenreichii]MCT2992016.1 ABC transporter permease [Propionibacterium freudenreichii]MCT2994188.1 ABC transporter permease [Propionibacterium freudenreichii]MDK9651908.1 FtsX-like permease family protein [Propionibacterium freudenreichii]MDK9664915.1 FtsX-like permease family protein [Propionibacterium freudenreichii]
MLMTFARRELGRRRRQTIIVALGLAIAVALLMVVHSVSSGVSRAQSEVLSSVYGVGTDITVTQKSTQQPGQGFDMAPGAQDANGNTSVSSTTVRTTRGTEAFDASQLATVQGVQGVAGATAVLNLEQTTFDGQIGSSGSSSSSSASPSASASSGTSRGAMGGGRMNLNQTTITGVEPGATLGPLSTLSVSSGRALATSDDGNDVALVSSDYASQHNVAVGGTISVANKDVSVVGIVTSTSSSSISEVYLPLKTAQALSDNTDKISEILVQASDSNQVSTVASALTKALPSATVSTQEALAQSVSGSLGSASKLISSLGTWLSIGVVVVAFGLAVLFTVSGVNQRTRDFGTLKALGWSRRRIVGQVATESLLRAGIGGAAGIVLGLVATMVINAMGITLSGSTGGFSMGGGRGAPGGQPSGMPSMAGGQAGGAPAGGGGGMAERASNAVNVVLHSPVSIQMIAIGLAAALVGGLLAGVIGGWRAGGMRPAEALRSVE